LIKYLGSKRRLVGELGSLFAASGAATALDLFTGTTRVAQEFCRHGGTVTCVDTAAYSEVLAQCYVVLDADAVDAAEVDEALARLAALPGRRGYVTEVFCEQSRYFHPDNGRRIDAIREGIDEWYGDHPLRPVLLTALAIGFVISLFQAVTQVQEVTLSFVPKLLGVAVVLVVAGHWMLAEAVSFTRSLFAMLPQLLA